jgi:hypothetical protein
MRCAPWSLTVEHKTNRKAVYSEFLAHFEAERETFLSQIVTAVETWVHHFEPETKSIHRMTPFSVAKKIC